MIMKTWFMIPVRGGSRGVPRKNIKNLGGKPLLSHCVETLLKVSDPENIILISDDEEILDFASTYKIQTLQEPKTTGKATLDDVTLNVINMMGSKIDDTDLFVTIQATCPFVTERTIKQGIELLKSKADSIITAIDDRHLTWGLDENGSPKPNYTARVNRQELPAHYRESGAVIGSKISLIKKNKTRINQPLELIPISKEEGVDIDDFSDWAVAEYIVNKKTIIIRTDASVELGMGHVYRSLSIAQELSKHKIIFITNESSPLGYEFLEQYPFEIINTKSEEDFFKLLEEYKPILTIVDLLDTSKEYIKSIKKDSERVITLEDMGNGAQEADLLISDLYKNLNLNSDQQLTGVQNSILAPSFETYQNQKIKIDKEVKRLLLIFGGSDPSNLTTLALKSLENIGFEGEVIVVQGLGRKDRVINLKDYNLKGEVLTNVTYMPKVMSSVDMAISSAGRTITELMTFGIPVICLCQNEKELSHTHASQQYGVMNLGLGKLIEHKTLSNHINFMLKNQSFREQMQQRALFEIKGRKNSHIISQIFEKINLNL